MKKQLKVVGFAALCAFFVVGSASAEAGLSDNGLCILIDKFKDIFKTLRTLAFIGAGWLIATWAWKYITEAKAIDPMQEVKDKGISMIVGFVLLFGIGAVLQIISSATGAQVLGCVTSGW